MPVASLFDEDHLIPIALADTTLFAFSQLEGCLYRISGQGRGGTGTYDPVPLTGFEAPFCVPGRPFVYDLIHAFPTMTVKEFPLVATGLGQPRERAHPSPPEGTHHIASLIPDAEEATLCLVFESLTAAGPTLLMDMRSGNLRPAAPVQGTPKCILTDGTLVAESEFGWSMVRDGKQVRHGVGSIIAAASEFVVVKRSNKSGARFSIVRSTGEEDISSPNGWSLISLAASDTRITAYGIHAELGQRLLHMEPGGESFTFMDTPCGTSQVFAMGAAVDPVVRSAGLVIGSSWRTQWGVIAGIAAERSDLRADHITPAGLPCIYVHGHQPRGQELVVCLHGGPDSHELDDLRYGGTYRAVLDAGFDLLIINYPGSAGFGSSFQERAWQNWDTAVRETAEAIAGVSATRGTSEVSIFGVSFGAWVGLQLADHVDARQVVAMSPILDLPNHIQLHKDDPEFRMWAAARFTLAEGGSDDGEQQVRNCNTPVVVIAPDEDEVVVPSSTRNSTSVATGLGRKWSIVPVPGNHYPKTSAAAEHRWGALFNAIVHRPR
ncbi:alpha/beta fold hydrolase [Arthrobacter sp. ISL-48]|uniref:alpha/beta fold hydrolase n=1 Tax=Arthrobacter sp. ISL-48 TaxID=2819110 RepID=UPI001BE8D1A4|nr:alpha/beta fold hydrolase [Arthrobacter sp. ISL-48]MBT2530961.1 alpha/beta fold hydrolase [Arthrobacter sp. ISL-48]